MVADCTSHKAAARLQLLSPGEAAATLGRKPQTMARWRCEGFGPKFVRVGGRIAYRVDDLEAWIASRVVSSTAQRAA